MLKTWNGKLVKILYTVIMETTDSQRVSGFHIGRYAVHCGIYTSTCGIYTAFIS